MIVFFPENSWNLLVSLLQSLQPLARHTHALREQNEAQSQTISAAQVFRLRYICVDSLLPSSFALKSPGLGGVEEYIKPIDALAENKKPDRGRIGAGYLLIL